MDTIESSAPAHPSRAMDVNGDDYLDLVTINDSPYDQEHLFLNDRSGGFNNATARLWPESENPGLDDNMDAFLNYDSDGDADLLIGSLSGPGRLLTNDGSGKLKLLNDNYENILGDTSGTLASPWLTSTVIAGWTWSRPRAKAPGRRRSFWARTSQLTRPRL